jgi:hypothetical protein
MPKTQIWSGRPPGKRAVRLLVTLAAVLAAACCVSACGGASAPTGSGTPASSGPPSGQGQGTAAVGHGTPGAALADWIRQVAAGNRSAACQDMRVPGLSARSSSAACLSAKGSTTFTALHGNFVTDGIKPGTPISVAAAHITGTNATVSGGDIHVSGTTLDSLMAAHSTGVKPGQVTIAFDLSRIDGDWYLTGMNMDV